MSEPGPGARAGERAVQTLDRLVAWPTVSDRPVLEMAAGLAQRAEDAGFAVERFAVDEGKVNVLCRKGPRSADRSKGLVLSGHMDVVPVQGQQWSSDPFKLTERDGRLFGRGTCDMKGFIAATLEACDRIKGLELGQELVLLWTCDEEVGCRGSAALPQQLADSAADPLPWATIIGEPTDFRICRLHPGHATWRIRCMGRSAHSSRPSLGLSAIKLATRVLLALEELEETLALDRRFTEDLPSPWPVLNTAIVRGGAAVNIVPDHCEILVGVRPLPGQPIEEIGALLAARVQGLHSSAEAQGGAISLDLMSSCPSLLTDAGCAHLPLLLPWARDRRPTGAPFATDGGNLALMGLQPLVFGPGSIDLAHRPDEHLPIADLHRAVDTITDLATRACHPAR